MDKKKILSWVSLVLMFLSTAGVSICNLTPAKPYCAAAAPLLVMGADAAKKASEGGAGGGEEVCEDGKTKLGNAGVCVCAEGKWLTHPDKLLPCP